MTNDYKEKLLNYLTGNVTPTSKSTTPYYLESVVSQNPGFELISQTYPYYREIKGSVKCKDGKGNYNGKILFWGIGEKSANSGYESFLYLTDENLNPITIITSYSSGYELFNIAKLEVAEDGNIYGIDYIQDGGTGEYKFRIVLFNNISEVPKGYATYQAILRNSYYIPGYTIDDDLSILHEVYIKKSPQSATYYYAIAESTGVNYSTGTFKINVGAANEWEQLQDIMFYSSQPSTSRKVFIYFDKDDIVNTKWYTVEEVDSDKRLSLISTIGNENPQSETLISALHSYFTTYANYNYLADLQVKENGEVFIALKGKEEASASNWEQKIIVYLYDGTMNQLFTKTGDATGTDANVNIPGVISSLSNDNWFAYIYFQKDLTDDESPDRVWYLMLNKENEINTLKDTGVDKMSDMLVTDINNITSLNNMFNLYYYNLFVFGKYGTMAYEDYLLTNTKLIYNNQNYNGESHTDKNSLVGNQGILLDTNNKPIFARNLYNYKVYNNRTISVLNIPNNLLNEVTISKEQLIGETNSTLFDSSQSIIKNIYEELFINFFTTLKMRNENKSIYIDNKEGAIRLNKSAMEVLDYENAKATKIRKNFSDGSNETTSISSTITSGVATYEITIQAPSDKTLLTIDILSEDEQTKYTTIDLTENELESGKYYVITQKVTIEGLPT